MRHRSIYVAATGQHVGKTTSTLGLIHSLRNLGHNIGYCKPVGQQYVTHDGKRVDKDTALFANFMGFDIEPEIHSPIILGPGDTQEFIESPEKFDLHGDLKHAQAVLESRHEFLVHEGTGHPGVGSVAEVSNSVVAQMLGAGLIMVVPAGIGNTIDKLDLHLSAFQQKNIPILGVIINKCIPEKIDKVRYYVGKKLSQRGIPILGILPYEEELGLPLMETICQAVKGETLFNEDQFDNKVQDIIAGSLIDLEGLKHFKNQLLVVSVRRFDDAIRKIKQVAEQNHLAESILSGVLLTGKGSLRGEHINYIENFKIPVIKTNIDTYEAVIKISKIEVKINTRTPWKVKKAVELFSEHVDLSIIKDQLAIKVS
jgi:BioD-like phosphotransacetylase family protein